MGERPRPLYSAHAEDPALMEAIDLFVLGLAGVVDDLQDAHLAGDCARLEQLTRELAERADFLGYAPLARLAEALVECATQKLQEESRGVLTDLTGIAQRIRMGHRGAI